MPRGILVGAGGGAGEEDGGREQSTEAAASVKPSTDSANLPGQQRLERR